MKNGKQQIHGFWEHPAWQPWATIVPNKEDCQRSKLAQLRHWTHAHLAVPKLPAWLHPLARIQTWKVAEPHVRPLTSNIFEKILAPPEHLSKFASNRTNLWSLYFIRMTKSLGFSGRKWGQQIDSLYFWCTINTYCPVSPSLMNQFWGCLFRSKAPSTGFRMRCNTLAWGAKGLIQGTNLNHWFIMIIWSKYFLL